MKLDVVTEENGIKSVWYPVMTKREWYEAVDEVVEDLKKTLEREDKSDE